MWVSLPQENEVIFCYIIGCVRKMRISVFSYFPFLKFWYAKKNIIQSIVKRFKIFLNSFLFIFQRNCRNATVASGRISFTRRYRFSRWDLTKNSILLAALDRVQALKVTVFQSKQCNALVFKSTQKELLTKGSHNDYASLSPIFRRNTFK